MVARLRRYAHGTIDSRNGAVPATRRIGSIIGGRTLEDAPPSTLRTSYVTDKGAVSKEMP